VSGSASDFLTATQAKRSTLYLQLPPQTPATIVATKTNVYARHADESVAKITFKVRTVKACMDALADTTL